MTTDRFSPAVKPVRVGFYDTTAWRPAADLPEGNAPVYRDWWDGTVFRSYGEHGDPLYDYTHHAY